MLFKRGPIYLGIKGLTPKGPHPFIFFCALSGSQIRHKRRPHFPQPPPVAPQRIQRHSQTSWDGEIKSPGCPGSASDVSSWLNIPPGRLSYWQNDSTGSWEGKGFFLVFKMLEKKSWGKMFLPIFKVKSDTTKRELTKNKEMWDTRTRLCFCLHFVKNTILYCKHN